jgi:hypothetical protein
MKNVQRWLVGLMAVLALVACGPPGGVIITTQPTVGPAGTAAQATTVAPAAVEAPVKLTVTVADSVPLVYNHYDAGTRTNIAVALAANGNRLRQASIINKGERWSFGEQLGDINALVPSLVVANGVVGGGWSDLAGRYISTWQKMGLKAEFAPAQRQLIDLEPAQSPMLWLGEATGNADVVLVNNSDQAVQLLVVEDNTTGQLTVHGTAGKG